MLCVCLLSLGYCFIFYRGSTNEKKKNLNKDFFFIIPMITQRMEDRWWIILILFSFYISFTGGPYRIITLNNLFFLLSGRRWLDLGLGRPEIELIPLCFLSCSNADVGKKRVYTFLAWATGGSAARETLALGRGQAQAGGRQRFSLQECRQQPQRRLLPVITTIDKSRSIRGPD